MPGVALPLAALSLVGGFHFLAAVTLLIVLGNMARERRRSVFWGFLGPFFWGFTALMVWSLSGADVAAMGIFGGILGVFPALAIVYALDPPELLAMERALEEDDSPVEDGLSYEQPADATTPEAKT